MQAGDIARGRLSTTDGVQIGAIVQGYRTLDILLHLARIRDMDIDPSPGGLAGVPVLAGHTKKVGLVLRACLAALKQRLQIFEKMQNWTETMRKVHFKKPDVEANFNPDGDKNKEVSAIATSQLLNIFQEAIIHDRVSHWHKAVANFAMAAFILAWNCEVLDFNIGTTTN